MHRYLKAIGFSNMFHTERDVELFLDNLYHSYDERAVVREEDGHRAYLELSKSFGPNIGVRICGEMDGHGFHRLCYYPYLTGDGITTQEEVTVESLAAGQGYAGLCDDGRVGVSMIFYLQNPAAWKKHCIQNRLGQQPRGITFSALAQEGVILLPGKKEGEGTSEEWKAYYSNHDSLVTAAKNGSQEAIESLTIEDMDTYAMITRRLMHEDILTIVDSYFMPFGLECDQYQILGEILFYTKVQNSLSGEYLYQMTLDVNGLVFDLCINADSLLGDPEIGRRFKGNIWLQGTLQFAG